MNQKNTVTLTTIELAKENFKFSAGHFTIFSKEDRERLHGHNFTVAVKVTAEVFENGMCFDYGIYKRIIEKICREWNEYFILPTQSPYLTIQESDDQVVAIFNDEKIPFLKKDVLLLPIANATLEEFSRLIIEKLTHDKQSLSSFGIHHIEVKVFSGPGQSSSALWNR